MPRYHLRIASIEGRALGIGDAFVALYLKTDGAVGFRIQRDMQRHALRSGDDGAHPRNILQAWLQAFGRDLGNRTPGNFHLGNTRQHARTAHHMVDEEEFLAVEMRAETWPFEVRSILVQERMQMGTRSAG